jgi:hypothetical protein
MLKVKNNFFERLISFTERKYYNVRIAQLLRAPLNSKQKSLQVNDLQAH